VILYEDELADNGVSLLTVKVVSPVLLRIIELLVCPSSAEVSLMLASTIILLQRVMPSCWFLLLRFWVSLLTIFICAFPLIYAI